MPPRVCYVLSWCAVQLCQLSPANEVLSSPVTVHDCCCCDVSAALQPQQTQRVTQTSGMAPLVQSAVLTDRRHILTKDADGTVDLWDIATATVKEHYGKVLQGIISGNFGSVEVCAFPVA